MTLHWTIMSLYTLQLITLLVCIYSNSRAKKEASATDDPQAPQCRDSLTVKP